MERLECYREIAGTHKDKRVGLLLCGLSNSQYEVLRDLVAPDLPKSQPFDFLMAKLRAHYGKPRNVRMERAKFRTIKREIGESNASYEVLLQNSVRYCGFKGAVLEDNLVKEIIQGINVDEITKRLLEKIDITNLQLAVDLAESTKLIHVGSSGVAAERHNGGISRVVGNSKEVCFRCMKPGHKANEKEKCKAIHKTCNTCGEKGHFSGSKFCKQKKEYAKLKLRTTKKKRSPK